MARIHCLLCLIAVAQPPAGEAAVPEFPSWPQPLARESSTRTWPQSSVAIQKQAVAAKPQRRLRRRVQGSKDRAYVWKDHRRLQEERCSTTADCGPNRYCMSCSKCGEYHASLPQETQRRWTCDPCQDGANICESGKYCTVAQDPAEGQCPTKYPGCSQHSDCEDTEYCYSCAKCQEYIKTHGTNETIWRCEPCPTEKGGFCSKLWWCPIRQDSVSGSCPEEPGCARHSDCQEGEYCESCELCLAFRNSLAESERPKWPCEPCPTVGGGICEPASICQIANDGIDNTCPLQKGCDANIQCRPDQYCMDCEKCAAYRESLPPEHRVYWPCGYCPTGRGGLCERRVFCSVANDGVSETCPLYEGCFKHTDCSDTEFCWSWDACVREDTTGTRNCGDKPIKDGFCNPISTCVAGRSIDGQCRGTKACNSHKDCGTDRGLFCTNWETCNARSPDICGPRPIHREGVCLPVEHCNYGFHAPLRGECPPWTAHNGTAGGLLEVREVLKLNGTLMLASFHQAINSWGSLLSHQERDYFLTQLHEYGSNTTERDDAEYVGIYEAMGGKLTKQRQVELSCPFVEVAIPVKGPKIFEARIFMSELQMSQKHAECSCVLGESEGRCPRGAGIVGDSFQPADYCHNPIPTISTDPNSEQEILPSGTIQLMKNCSGSIKVTTSSGFGFELRSPGSKVRFLRLDSYEVEEVMLPMVTLPATPTTAWLAFDGDSGLLACSSDFAHRAHCGSLPRGVGVPVVLESINVGTEPAQNTVDQLSRKKYCTSCRFALSRFHPVWFYNSAGQAIENDLTLYSMRADLTKPAVLVDSRKAQQQGEGESVQGCPWREETSAKGPSLQKIRDNWKVLPPEPNDGNVADKWCVVQTGGCSISAKVKFCVVGGAAGVLIMEAPGDSSDSGLPVPDKQGQVYLSEGESLTDLVPVLFTSYNAQLWTALLNGEEQRLTAGPGVGVRPALSHAVSLGGVRVYDSEKDSWTNAGGGFGAQRWMKHSPVRDVLFVCNRAQRILILDTSRSDNILAPISQAPESLVCSASATLRDSYLVDFRQGDKFFTVFVDTGSDRNHLVFFETTSLDNWKRLSEVHANWEHEAAGQGGLGQVVATEDGQKLLVTWHCSTLYCGSQRRSDGQTPGQHLYVLSLTAGLELGYAPPVVAAIKVPMSSGSIIRDVACNVQNLCLVSLSWDGVVAVDMAEGPNRFKVVGQHSASFAGWTSAGGLTLAPEFNYLRMVAGAQKVIPSRSRINRFYIERWNFNLDKFNAVFDIAKSLRFDSIWAIDIDNYVRPSFGVGAPPMFDPAVLGRLIMPKMSSDMVSAFGTSPFEDKLAEGLQVALGIDSSRLLVTSLQEDPDSSGIMADFSILDGYGPSPETLFNALWRQLLEPRSSINAGAIADWVVDAKLERMGPPPVSFRERVGRFARDWAGNGGGGLLLFLAALLCGTVGGLAACWTVRTHMAMKRLTQENRRLREEHDNLSNVVGSDTQVGLATGYVTNVIGRPNPEPSGATAPSGKDPDARDATGALSFVVGAPVGSGEASSRTPGGEKSRTEEQPERAAPTGWPTATEVSASPREDIVIRPAIVRAPTFERTDRP